jgi:thiol-disulfide isomerase/thioredoxin
MGETGGGSTTPGGRPARSWAGLLVGALLLGAGMLLVFFSEPVPAPLAHGDAAPEIRLPRESDGTPLALSDLRDRVVLLNFWASWCKPCEEEMPAMERLYQSLEGQPFELVAVSVDSERADVEEFRRRLGLSFPILLDPEQKAARLYQTTGYPESFLIDGDGRLVQRYVGPRDWDAPVYRERILRLTAGDHS